MSGRGRRNQVGCHRGLDYMLEYDQRKNQQACDPEHLNEWRWFLWFRNHSCGGWDYIGDFKRKADAIQRITAHRPHHITADKERTISDTYWIQPKEDSE